jgi:glyoxylase-like metal-dependent hydrolase (beta-lactamase superfamily II)
MEQHLLSRKHFLRSAGLLTAGILIDSQTLFAQTSPVITIKTAAAKDSVVVKKIRDNIYILEGSGGNITVFDGKDGKMLVDSGIAVSKQKIMGALSSISAHPIRYLINTHWHFDHSEGNEWIQQSGARILAHENTRNNMSKTIRVRDWNYTFSPSPVGAIPSIVFRKHHMLEFNGSKVDITSYGLSAHTDCDISVYFKDADVLSVGDTWWNSFYPFIDHSTGGTLDGMIRASNYNLSIVTDKTIIIPGHGSAGNKKQLTQFRDMLVSTKERISKLKKSGKTLAQTIAARPTATYDAKYGGFAVDPAFFTRLIYADV